MTRFALFFFRLIAITAGFVIACIVAAVAEILLNGLVTPGAIARLRDGGFDAHLVFGTLGLSSLIGHAAFLPGMAAILITEIARLRDWLSHVIGGAVVAGIIVAVAHSAESGPSLDAARMAFDIVSGMLGGLAYWLFAGWRAGRWLPSEAASAHAKQPSTPVR